MRVILLLLSVFALVAAEPKKEAPRTAASGGADAAVAFGRQAGQAIAPTGPEPSIIGAYVWGGRADESYRPFFQWEFRLLAGTAALNGLKIRTLTLMPDRSVAATGAWVEVGALAAGTKKDVSVRQNCSAFSSYQVDCEWSDGKASYVCSDKTALPVAQSLNAERAYLITTAYDHDPENAKKPFVVTWWLWNVGGQPATEVVQTVKFLDEAGKEVHSVEVPVKDPLKGNGSLVQKLTLKERPKGYKAVSVNARCADVMIATGPADAGFTGAKDLEIAAIAVAGGKLSAKVRNGLGKELVGAVVTVTLQDAAGKELAVVKLPCGTLAPGEEKALSAACTAKGFAGYEVAWGVEDKPATATATPAATGDPVPSAVIVVKVKGLEFTQTQSVAEGGTLYVKGELTNRTGRDLTSLIATFSVGTAATVYKSDKLAKDETAVVALEMPGATTVEKLTMGWTAK